MKILKVEINKHVKQKNMLNGVYKELNFDCILVASRTTDCGDYKEYGQQMKKGKEKQKHDICRPLSTKTRLNIFINFNPYFVGQ